MLFIKLKIVILFGRRNLKLITQWWIHFCLPRYEIRQVCTVYKLKGFLRIWIKIIFNRRIVSDSKPLFPRFCFINPQVFQIFAHQFDSFLLKNRTTYKWISLNLIKMYYLTKQYIHRLHYEVHIILKWHLWLAILIIRL